MVQGSIGLNVAVVGISHARELEEPPGGWIADVLEEAGHHVVERAYLVDDLALIRGRFETWVAGVDVDVVIVTCDVASTCTAAALAPLITRPLAGFGDMLQQLTIQGGANALALASAKAALCTSTFVFLLPTSLGALRIALDRLVLPRLDYRAKPLEVISLPEAPAAEKPAVRTKTIPPPLPARALARSEIDDLFSDPILLVKPKAPARDRRDSTPAPGPMISIPLGRANHEVIADVSSWAPRPRKRRRLATTLVASLLVTAGAAAVAIPHMAEHSPQPRTHVAQQQPTLARPATVRPAIAPLPARPEPAADLSAPQHVAQAEIELPPEQIRTVAKPVVVKPPAAEKPAAAPAVAEAPAAEPAAVEPAPAIAESAAPPIASSCDEVSCALDRYEGDCCAKFNPGEVAETKPATRVPDQIDRTMILDGMAKMKPAIVRCDQRYGVKGTVNLAIKVGPDGAVANVSVASSPDAALGDCVATAIRKASFAKTEIGGSFHYPFMF